MITAGTAVLPCPCGPTAGNMIKVKSGGVRRADKPTMLIPWHNTAPAIAYQEAKYGPGMRLHNLGSRGNKGNEPTANCTICGKEKLR